MQTGQKPLQKTKADKRAAALRDNLRKRKMKQKESAQKDKQDEGDDES